MASIPESIRNSSVNLGVINESIRYTKRSTSKVNDSVDNISRIIKNNSRIKNDLFMKSQLIDSRRRDASRRQEIEDQIESKKVSFIPQRGLAYVKRLSSGPMSRIMGFLGFVTAGWIVENLPTWMFMGKEFVTRIQKFGGSMYRMVDNIKILVNFFGQTLKNSLDAIVRLDFKEFTEGNVLQSFQGMTSTIEDLGKNITDTFNLFRTPLTESMETGEKAPDLGETQPNTMFPGVQQETGISRVSGIHKQALDIISKPESGGSYNAMNQGTVGADDRIVGSTLSSRTKIKKDLTSMTIGEIMKRQAYLMNKSNPQVSDYGIYAAGKYQIIPGTFETAVTNAGLSPNDMFSPENQDKMGLAVLRSQGIGAWTAGGSSYSASERAIVEKARRTPVTYTTTAVSSTPTITPSTPATSFSNYRVTRNGANIKSLAQLPAHGGNTRKADGRLIQDFTLYKGNQFVDVPVPSPVNGTINFSGYSGRGGNWVEIKSSEGIVELGHFNSLKVKQGDKVSVGTILGLQGYSGSVRPVGRDGTHVHIQANDSVIARYISMLVSGTIPAPQSIAQKPRAAQAASSAMAPSIQPATVTAAPPQLPSITPERQGQNILMVDNTQPQIQAPAPQAQSPIAPPVSIDEFKLLNNFIKNKLLLDLAYL